MDWLLALMLAFGSAEGESIETDCRTLETAQPHTDCWLPLDGLGVEAVEAHFDFDETRPHHEDILIEIRAVDGSVTQTLRAVTMLPFYPELADIDGDDHPDLIIRVDGGSANLDHAIFMGEFGGFQTRPLAVNAANIRFAGDGLTRIYSRENAATGIVQLAVFDGQVLRDEAILQLTYDPRYFPSDDYDPDVSGPVCRLVEGGEDLSADYYCALARN
ncbi:hypothetical protein [Maricaulis parjimensis]|uniref:hypothetical protein n=1 Tax=Maricaulis parjimensis TaxID=144023 RepID=UPI00193AA319|nr:hypothetical protein [Maricaulis parjimensis]